MLNGGARIRGRSGERGQTLLAALAFLGFFALLGVAVFGYADVVQTQHRIDSSTAASHGPSEGAGMYALVDQSRPDASACSSSGGGSISFKTGASSSETLSYAVASGGCGLGSNGNSGGPGEGCALCILGISGHTTFTANRAVTVYGEVDMNGAADFASPNGALCSMKSTASTSCDGTIVDHNAGDISGFSPAPVSPDPGVVEDPLLGAYPTPPSSVAAGTVSGGVAHPGFYANLSNDQLCPGLYVVTGSVGGGLTAAPSSSCTANPGTGVTIFLACGNSSSWQPCATAGAHGGTVSLSGNDTITLSAPSQGAYANLLIFSDAHNTSTWSLSGNATVNGTGNVYVPQMTLSTNGNGITVSVGGRMVIGVVALQGSVSNPGLNVNGGTIPAASTCNVVSDTVSTSGTPANSRGHVVLQTKCRGGDQMISFDYAP